jgi:hypothetical protein
MTCLSNEQLRVGSESKAVTIVVRQEVGPIIKYIRNACVLKAVEERRNYKHDNKILFGSGVSGVLHHYSQGLSLKSSPTSDFRSISAVQLPVQANNAISVGRRSWHRRRSLTCSRHASVTGCDTIDGVFAPLTCQGLQVCLQGSNIPLERLLNFSFIIWHSNCLEWRLASVTAAVTVSRTRQTCWLVDALLSRRESFDAVSELQWIPNCWFVRNEIC